MENNKTQKLVKASILTSLIVVFAAASFYLPLVGMITAIVIPIITALIYKTSGRGLTLVSFFSTLLLLLILIDPISAVSMTIVYYSIGLGLMLVIGHQYRPLTKLLVIAFFVALSLVIMMTINLLVITGMNLTQFMEFNLQLMKDTMVEVAAMYERMGVDTSENPAIAQTAEITVQGMLLILPTVVAIYALVSAYVIHKVSEKVFKPFGIILEKLPKFNEIKSNMIVVAATLFVAMAGVFLVNLQVPQGESIMVLGKSMFDIAAGIGGLSLISFYLTTKLKINKFSRVLIMYLVFSTPIFFSIAIILGVVDSAFDFRNMNDDGLASIIRRKMKS